MNTAQALNVLLKNKMIRNDDSVIAAVIDIRESAPDPIEVAATLCEINNKYSFPATFRVRNEANIENEKRVFELYYLKYLAVELIRYKTVEADSQLGVVLKDAAKKASDITVERLYGSMQFLDATDRYETPKTKKVPTKEVKKMSTETKLIKQADGNPVVTKAPKVASEPAAPKQGGKVAIIFARIKELYGDQGKSKADTLAAITAEFQLKTASTAVTYYNDALRFWKIAKRPE